MRDPLFVGATRPPMRWGVTYAALLANLVVTLEIFLLSKNLLVFGLALPIHAIGMLLCARDPRCFELLALWVRTRGPAYWSSLRYWRASTRSPLRFDLPDIHGRRRACAPTLLLVHAARVSS